MSQFVQKTVGRFFTVRKRSNFYPDNNKRRKLNWSSSFKNDNFINMEVVTPMDTSGDEEPANNDVASSNAEASATPPKVLPERRYSREVLISLMNHPLSRRRPTCLDSAALKNIVSTRGQNKNPWEQSGVERKRGDSNCEDDKVQGENSKRRVKQLGSLEPRERLRKEQDVVLSPQRRSFNSGCFVSLSTSQNRNFSSEHRGGRPESPAIAKESRDVNHIGSRRIGSGRIMSRDPVWDYRDSDINQDHYRSRDERFDKRTFDRRNDHDKDKFQRDKINNRYSGLGMDRRRTLTENKSEEEPEWFSGGPTSQHDTIELHGFEDLHDEKPMNNKKQNKKSNSRSNKKNLSESENKPEKSSNEIPVKKVNQKKNSTVQEAETFIDKLVEKFSDVPMVDVSNNQSGLSNTDLNNMLGSSSPCNDFNFDDFLKNSDRVVGLLSDRTEDEDHRGGSKFSRWFHQESAETPVQEQSVSRESSIFSNILSDLTAPSEKKTDTDTYFAPISPAATSSKMKSQKTETNSICLDKTASMDQTSQKSSALLEILQGGARNQDRVLGTPSLQELEKTGKIHSVEELEAKLRRPNQEQNKEQDGLAAFKKLFSLVGASKSRNSMADLSEKSSLQHMLNKANSSGQSSNLSDHKDQSGILYSGNYQQQNFPLSSNIEHNLSSQQMQIPQDLVLKLLHVQQQQQQQAQQQAQQQQPQQAQHLAKLLNNNVNSGTRLTPTVPQFNVPPPLSPLPPDIQQMISNAQPTNELLQRPEAQALIIGLKRGQISLYNLIEQLKKNSAIQPRHREVLACVIKMQQHQLQAGGVGPLPTPACDSSTTQPCGLTNSDQMLHQILLNQQQAQHQQQQLRIPSPHNSLLQRVPSPRELVVHTQNIMQSALIKKKLEEQRENYRKRQELQRSHSPNIAASSGSTASSSVTTSTSPLAFTPTSVLRKMTAEKEPTQQDSTSKSINADSQGNQAVGSRPVTVPTSQNQMRSNSWDILKPHKGRPIVKGSNSGYNYQPAGNTNIPTGMEFPHQFPNMTRNKMSAPVQQNPALHYNSSLMVGVNQTSGNRARSIQQAHLAASLQAQQRNVNSSLQQILLNPNYGNNVRGNMKQDCRVTQQPGVVRPGVGSYNQNPLMSGVGVRVEPSTSPVSNQLARWFSPELLAQARAGHLPDMSPTQNMLSVEELERLQQAVPN